MVTTIETPQLLCPVYNPINFVVDSTNKSEDNFVYIFDLYESQGVTLGDRLARLRIPAEPITGYGVFNPQKILQNYVENIFPNNLTGCVDDSSIEFSVVVGEAYTFIWDFDVINGVFVTGSTYLLNVKLSGSTQHYYNEGDIINISGCSIAQYNGNWEVLDVPNQYSVTLDLAVSSLLSSTGATKLFNDEQTFFTGLTTLSGFTAHNAAIDTFDFIDYRVDGFVLNNYYPSITGSTEFYTNAYEVYKTRLVNRGSFVTFQNSYEDSLHPNPDTMRVTTSDGGVFDVDLDCSGTVIQIGVFPWNLNNLPTGDITIISGTLPMIKTSTETYEVSLRNKTIESVTISYVNIYGANLPTTFYPAGIYNGKNYYTWTSTITFYLWYDTPNLVWVVSNALGGGNDYLQSISSGSTYSPPQGVYGVQWVDGSNPLFTNFSLTGVTSPILIQPFSFEVYDFCGKWDSFEFIFMDRKGSWLPMNLELVQRKNIEINRKTFKRGLGRDYTYTDRSTTVVQNDLSYRYTVNSNWLTEEQSLLFEEFLTSPEVFWNYKGEGIFIPINILSTNQEIKDKKNTRLINYVIDFTPSTNPKVQIG